ncbi:MAG: hypothetical protein ACR2I5_02840 [Candidatus Limnocylindria bacterium]
MSGPWDRPPPDAGDSWPSEDRPDASTDEPGAEPWPADPWNASEADASSGWGAWPPPPPPEVGLPDDAELPVADPWAETWTDETADPAPAAQPDPEPWVSREPARAEPWMPTEDPWSLAADDDLPPASDWSPPAAAEPEPKPRWSEPAPLPAAEPSWEPAPARPTEPAPEPEPEPEPEPKPEPEPEPEPEPAGPPEPEPEPDSTPDVPPDLESEQPGRSPVFEPDVRRPSWAQIASDLGLSEPNAEAPPEPESLPEPAPEPEPDASDVESEAVEPPNADAVDEAEPEPRPEPEPSPDDALSPQWPELSESTQVLPSGWAPPEPPVRDRPPGLNPMVGRVKVSVAEAAADGADAEADAEEEPTTAEQAVPWLIGVILLLAGMVIVLLALIFAGDASLGSTGALPSGSALGVVPSGGIESASPTPTRSPSVASPTAAPSTTPTPAPVPEYGALEMLYQGRSAALAPIYLLRRDFTKDVDTQEVMAQDPTLDVRRFAWARDGTVGVGLLADVLVSIEPGKEKRRLADGISTVTFGADGSAVYAARITQDGANDVATIFAIDFLSEDSSELAAISYVRPSLGQEEALAEAQFSDEGGPVRLYWLEDGTMRFWSLGAGTWQIDPANGAVSTLGADERPTLWSPHGDRRIRTSFADGSSTISLLDRAGDEVLAINIEGRVSHLRWAPEGGRVVFTLGRSAAGGGVLQDLFLWDLDDAAPMQLTATGAGFGAEWLGTEPLWRN